MFEGEKPTSPANWHIADGMTVYATDGDKLGTVRNYNPQAGYLDVHKGVLFTKDFYVPMSAVDTVAEDGVTLRLTKDDLKHDRYSSPPVGQGTAYDTQATTGAGTMTDTWASRKEPWVEDSAGDLSRAPTAKGEPDPSGLDRDVRKTDERTTGW